MNRERERVVTGFVVVDQRGGEMRALRLALSACLILLGGAGLLISLAGRSGPARASPTPTPTATATATASTSAGVATKYYVVGQPASGQREYLFAIAAKTLGDGKRYLEIFKLNEGRVQPDGLRLEDPAVLEPGWVLELPQDAKGPDVRTGPLPGPFGPLPHSHHSTPNAPPSTGHTPDITITDLVRVGALAGIMILLGWASRALLRGHRLSLPSSRRDSDQDLNHQVATSAPPPATDDLHGTASVVAATRDVAAPPAEPDPPPGTRSEPSDAGGPATGTRREARRGDDDAMADTRHTDSPARPDTETRRLPVLHAELAAGRDAVAVRLVGVRSATDPPGEAWVYAAAEGPYGGTAPVALGENGHGTLYVDLALAPDVVTITGPREGRQRQGLSLARQLARIGVAVAVVDNVLDSEVPPGCRVVPTFDEAAREAANARAALYFVFLAGTEGTDLTAIRRAVSVSVPRLIPVLLGDAPRARWSIDVQPERTDAEPSHRKVQHR